VKHLNEFGANRALMKVVVTIYVCVQRETRQWMQRLWKHILTREHIWVYSRKENPIESLMNISDMNILAALVQIRNVHRAHFLVLLCPAGQGRTPLVLLFNGFL
jgi:hypothetical protein